ncbi:hypothetical protein [Alsobacter sp. R-9]
MVQPFAPGSETGARPEDGRAEAVATGAAETGGSGLDATGVTGGSDAACTGWVGAAVTEAVDWGSTRAEVPKGLPNGLSANRIVSELQAAERLPMAQTKATRATD